MTGSDVVGSYNCITGAVLSTLTATDTLVSVDNDTGKILTAACGATLLEYVSLILLTEVAESRENRVRSSLTKTAERGGSDGVCKLLELFNVTCLALTVSDLGKDLKHSLGTLTARSTLTAGLVNGELKEELSDVNHTVVFVHNDKSA